MTPFRRSLVAMLAVTTGCAAFEVATAGPTRPIAPVAGRTGMAWVRKPSAEDVARVYPSEAQSKNLSGAADIHCKFTADGRLTNCVVLGETPVGAGFGRAALALAPNFQARALAGKGFSIEGGTVNIPIRFSLNENPTPVLSMNDGRQARLVTITKSESRSPTHFDCPSADNPKRRCEVHLIVASQAVDPVVAADILAKAGVQQGESLLECGRAADGALSDCKLNGSPNAQVLAAALEWASRLRVPEKAQDGARLSDGLIVLSINWAMVKQVRDAVAAAH